MAEIVEKATEQDGIQHFAEAVFRVTRRGGTADNYKAEFLAGLVIGYGLQVEMEATDAHRAVST